MLFTVTCCDSVEVSSDGTVGGYTNRRLLGKQNRKRFFNRDLAQSIKKVNTSMSLGMTSTYGQSTVEIILRTVFRLRSTYLMLLTIHGLAVLRLQAKVEDSCFHIWYVYWGTVFTFFFIFIYRIGHVNNVLMR